MSHPAALERKNAEKNKDVYRWISYLGDPNSFQEFNHSSDEHSDGHEIITGFLKVNSRTIAVYGHDATVDMGFISSAGAAKIVALMEQALKQRTPIVALLSSPGISIREGVKSGHEFTRLIMANSQCSGHIPQIAGIMGVVMGGSSYSALLMDFIVFNKRRSHLMISGPAVVEAAIGEKATLAKLGGAEIHAAKTGMAHFVVNTIDQQLDCIKRILDYLPSSAFSQPIQHEDLSPKLPIPSIPNDRSRPFDMMQFVLGIVDESDGLVYNSEFGRSIITMFARLGGRSVGIVANQSRYASGAIDADAAQKSARFIRLCDAYNIPIVTFIDVPGYMVGSREEQKGILRQGATMIQALNTRVPKLSVVVRRCYGAAAFVMMQTAAQDGDLVLALDESRIAIMGFDAAKKIIYGDQSTEISETELRQHYFETYEHPSVALRDGLIDGIVSAKDLRSELLKTLRTATNKEHINFPQPIFP